MKKQFIAYLANQISKLKSKKNSVSGEELKAVEEAIAEIEKIKTDAEAAEEEVSGLNILKQQVEALTEKIKALQEKEQANPQPVEENYLKSRNALHDYAKALQNGIRTRSENAFQQQWGEALRKNGVTFSPDEISVLMPDYVKGKIQDLWSSNLKWLEKVGYVNTPVFYGAVNTADDESGAKQHTRGTTKTNQNLTLTRVTITCEMIYKLLPVDEMTVYNDNDGAFIDYVVNELGYHILKGKAEAILTNPNAYSAFTAVNRAATDSYVTVATHSAANEYIDEIVGLVSNVQNEGRETYVFMNSTIANILRRRIYGAGGSVQYVGLQEVANELGVTEVIVDDTTMSGTNAGAPNVIVLVPHKYMTVGENSPRLTIGQDVTKNILNYRMEAPMGGKPYGLKMGAVLKHE